MLQAHTTHYDSTCTLSNSSSGQHTHYYVPSGKNNLSVIPDVTFAE